MQFSDSLWIEEGAAVDIAGGNLRVLDSAGNFFALSCKASLATSVTTVGSTAEVALTAPAKWLLRDPLMGSPDSPRRATRVHLRHLSSGLVLEYSYAKQIAQISLARDVIAVRDSHGGFRLSSSAPISAKIRLSLDPFVSPLTLAGPATDVDATIHLLVAARRPAGLAKLPGAWLATVETAGDQPTPDSQAWMLEQALEEYPNLSATAKIASGDGLESQAEAVDQASDEINNLSRSAVDRYLYDAHFGARLLDISRSVWQLLSPQAQARLSDIEQRINKQIPPKRWPARLQVERFARPHIHDPILNLDQLNLWSLFAARSIIATHLSKRKNESRS